MSLSCSPWPVALLPIILLLLLLLTFIVVKLSIQQHLLFSFLLLVTENPLTTPLSFRFFFLLFLSLFFGANVVNIYSVVCLVNTRCFLDMGSSHLCDKNSVDCGSFPIVQPFAM